MTENDTNHQFQIPHYGAEDDIRGRVDYIADPMATPERQMTSFESIKHIEQYIFNGRIEVLSTGTYPIERRRSLLQIVGLMPEAEPTMHDLVDYESKLGGRFFGRGDRFWLDIQSSTGNPDYSDWYHAQFNPADPVNPTVIRFQTTPDGIHKIYKGVVRTLTAEDYTAFLVSVSAYASRLAAIYPMNADAARAVANLLPQNPDHFDLAA